MASPAATLQASPASSSGTPSSHHRHRPSLSSVPQEPIRVAVRVRPNVRDAARSRSEDGFPYASTKRLAALKLEEAQRAGIE